MHLFLQQPPARLCRPEPGTFPARSRSRGFAFFLLLGDDFRSSRSALRLRGDRFFFHRRREHRERGQIRLHFGDNALRQLNITNVNRIADIERRNIDRNPVRQIARQTFDRSASASFARASHQSS